MKPYYQDASITIYCGDCRAILPSLEKVDLLLTDPPYGIGFAAQPTLWQRRKGAIAVSWDDKPPDESLILQIVAMGETAIVWGGNYFWLSPARCWLSWHKPDAPPSMGNVEYAWTNMDRNSRQMSRSISATNAERVGHPTQKPLSVMQWCLGFVPNAKTILDPFMGSGTTLVAAKLEGRKAIGIEINEKYCEIAAERLRQGVLF